MDLSKSLIEVTPVKMAIDKAQNKDLRIGNRVKNVFSKTGNFIKSAFNITPIGMIVNKKKSQTTKNENKKDIKPTKSYRESLGIMNWVDNEKYPPYRAFRAINRSNNPQKYVDFSLKRVSPIKERANSLGKEHTLGPESIFER